MIALFSVTQKFPFMSISSASIDIMSLLRDERVVTYFQPITSVRRQGLLGIEALSRGLDEEGKIVPPQPLFEAAEKANLARELDRLCRRRALETFAVLHRTHPQWILFLNVHSSALITDREGQYGIEKWVRHFGIEPCNVALEILETEFEDTEALRSAVLHYRAAGFLMVLDDVGAGHANLDRIAFVRPDMIKADGSLVREIEHDYYSRQVFKSLVTLSEKIGGWIITEGVETPEQAIAVLDLGGDIVQGFHFARPHPPQQNQIAYDHEVLAQTALQFKARVLQTLHLQREAKQQRGKVLDALRAALQNQDATDFEATLRTAFPCEKLESVAILDDGGVQITPTFMADVTMQKPKSLVFAPPTQGTDHSMKEYVYALRETSGDSFETQPYVPLPSGDLCITISTGFVDKEGCQRILVAHFQV